MEAIFKIQYDGNSFILSIWSFVFNVVISTVSFEVVTLEITESIFDLLHSSAGLHGWR